MNENLETALALRPKELPAEPMPNYIENNGMYDGMEEGMPLREYWRSVRKRLWMVISLAILITAIVSVFLIRQPNVYEAKTRVQVDLESNDPVLSNVKNGSVIVNNSVNDPAYFNTQLQILSGPGLLRKTVKTLNLEHNPKFLAAAQKRPFWYKLEQKLGLTDDTFSTSTPDAQKEIGVVNTDSAATVKEDIAEAERLAPYVEVLQRGLKIEPVKETRLQVKDTRLIEVSFSHEDPQMAADVVNAIASTYVLANLEKKTKTNTSSGDFLQKRIAELQTQIRGGEEKLISYAKSNQILSLDASQNTVVDRLTGLNKQLLEAENERKLAEAAYKSASIPGAANALAEENAKEVRDAEQKLTELQQRRAELLVETTEEWPEVKEIDQKIAVLLKQIKLMRERSTSVLLTNLQTRYNQSLQREQALRFAFDEQRGQTITQNEAAINYRIIQQEIETNKNLLDGLLQRAKENDVILAGTPNNISIADYAIKPRLPIGPKRILGVIIAFGLSLVLGVCLAIFLEYLDNTIRTAEDIERTIGLPALAAIPSVGGLTRRRLLPAINRKQNQIGKFISRPELLIHEEARKLVAEPYKQLRTSILLSTAGRAPKTLLITSGQQSEGKTSVSINTAISLAQTGASVLVIDADMRRPMIHKSLGMSNVVGLSTILSRNLNQEEILALIEENKEAGLYVLTSGSVPPNPAELLGSAQMKRLLSILETHFDYIVIDSPPIATITDGVLLASIVDGVVLVVHSGRSSRELVRRSRQLLRGVGARIVGVVLNNVNPQEQGDYYGNYYNNYYHSESPQIQGRANAA